MASSIRTARWRGLIWRLDQRQLVVLVVFLVILAFDYLRPTDIDYWWHLKTGELIATTGIVPSFDSYSFAAAGRPWVAHEWLWEVGLFAVSRLGGYRLAVVVSSMVVALTYFIGYRLLRRLGVNELIAAPIVLWAATLAVPSIGTRPRELSLLFLAFYVSQLWRYRPDTVSHLWSLPLVMALWVNVHGLFIFGLGLYFLFGAGEILTWRLTRTRPPIQVALVGLAMVAAVSINPQGPKMLLYPVGYFFGSDNPSFATVSEFQAPTFHEPISLLFAASLLILIVLGTSPSRLDIGKTVGLLVFALLALVSFRNIPAFAIVAAPILASRLRDRFAWARALPPARPTRFKLGLNWAILVLLVGMGISYSQTAAGSQRLQLGITARTDGLPVAGAEFIEQHRLPGPIFNSQAWGGYLIDRWYPLPERRVFIDGRVDMYGRAIVDKYLEVADIRIGWRATLDAYAIQTILIEKDSGLSTLLVADGGWERVFRGDVEDVFVRRSAP